MLDSLRSDCVAGIDSFSGGLVGGDVTCDPCSAGMDRIRRIDGVCNNLANNKHWGAAGIPMRRLAAPAYADGVSAPRTLPLSDGPRQVSNGAHNAGSGPEILSTKGFTHMAMQFGQFLDHDITITPQAGQIL